MPLTPDGLAKQALRTSVEPRTRAAEHLVENLADAEAGEIAKLWTSEAFRRRDDIRTGKVHSIPGEDVIAEVRRAIGR